MSVPSLPPDAVPRRLFARPRKSPDVAWFAAVFVALISNVMLLLLFVCGLRMVLLHGFDDPDAGLLGADGDGLGFEDDVEFETLGPPIGFGEPEFDVDELFQYPPEDCTAEPSAGLASPQRVREQPSPVRMVSPAASSSSSPGDSFGSPPVRLPIKRRRLSSKTPVSDWGLPTKPGVATTPKTSRGDIENDPCFAKFTNLLVQDQRKLQNTIRVRRWRVKDQI